MTTPPQTPTRPRHGRTNSSSSFANYSPSSPFSRHRRRSSAATAGGASTHSPVSRRQSRAFGDEDVGAGGAAAAGFGGGGGGGGDGGLGNLADELGDSWDEDEEGQRGDDEESGEEYGEGEFDEQGRAKNGSVIVEVSRDSGIAMERSPPLDKGNRTSLSPEAARAPGAGGKKHRRAGSIYDGSDYGDSSDLEVNDGLTPGLEKQMAAVESLVRRGLEENGSQADGVVARVTEKLRDLGSQSIMEGGATRLTTAHSALSTHVSHQTRHLLSLNSTLFSPLAPPLPPDLIEPIIPLISDTLASIPHPTYTTLNSLISLSNSTHELIDTLSLLSDTLHMSRQTSLAATRRLRSVRDQLAEWTREQDAADEARRYLERGQWDRRLREREASRVCRDVVGGFEAACEGWRRKLVATLEAC